VDKISKSSEIKLESSEDKIDSPIKDNALKVETNNKLII
jgi:hypothetical protein